MPPSRSKNKKSPKPLGRKRIAAKSARRQSANSAGHVGKLFEELVAVQARLRAPGGCPWDREQTHLTLRTYLIEEAYEVLDAIEQASDPELAEELGDLLLQVLFHADLAREVGAFDISDVITGIRDKMIRRHPHVFGNVKAKTSADVLKNWSKLKAEEKSSGRTVSTQSNSPSALEGVPRSLPALLEAYQLTRRAAHVGFDWKEVEGIFEKLQEEILELRQALRTSGSEEIEEELGDILFSAVNLARFLKVDSEVALKRANLKFKQRFLRMEKDASQMGEALPELTSERLEELWNAAKGK